MSQVSSFFPRDARGQIVADIRVGTEYITTGYAASGPVLQPIGISFACARWSDEISPRLKPIVLKDILGLSHLNFDLDKQGSARGHLSECACDACNRGVDPSIRTDYENRVLEEVLNILEEQGRAPFHLKLGIFCSSDLLAEKTLLSRLLHAIRGYSGTLELFLIDRKYGGAIQNTRHGGSLRDAVGQHKAMAQFIQELSESIPSSIEVQGTFFAEGNDYLDMVSQNPAFRHHLLIGSDIEEAAADMGEVGLLAGSRRKPIALAKTAVSPLMGRVESNGALTSVSIPGGKAPSSQNPLYWRMKAVQALGRPYFS